jgi:hypothetical protein
LSPSPFWRIGSLSHENTWIGDRLVPVIDRQLAGNDRRAAIVPILDNLKHVATLLGSQAGEAPIVED